MLTVVARLVIAGLLVAAGQGSQRQNAVPPPVTTARPTLEFEKTRFAVGERVFFWVGVTKDDADTKPIPRSVFGTLRVILTRPDGTHRIDQIGWPIDGMGTHEPGDGGWRGGHGLGTETPQLGIWLAVVEFAGRRTEPVAFSVENDSILKDIEATFVFPSPLVLDDPEAGVTLTVRNKSSVVIRFVDPGQNNSYASVNLTRIGEPGWGSSFFVPRDVLAAGKAIVPMSVDKLTWADLKRFPNVSIAPGAAFERRLPVVASLNGRGPSPSASPIPAGEYSVRFSTVLQLLPGEPDGLWKDFAPVRLEVTSTTTGRKR